MASMTIPPFKITNQSMFSSSSAISRNCLPCCRRNYAVPASDYHGKHTSAKGFHQLAHCSLKQERSHSKKPDHQNHVPKTTHDAPANANTGLGGLQLLLQKAGTAVAGAALAVMLSMAPAIADEDVGLTVTFSNSSIPEVSNVQKTLVEAWGIVQETYWDPTFNSHDWNQQLEDSLVGTFKVSDADEAFGKIRAMLATLGDPFTRIISPQEYQSFRISNDGALEGVGLLIASEPQTGRLIVLSPIEGGPAARAGVHPGDELVRIDDEELAGLTGEEAATRLRGRAGTSVVLTLRRDTDATEGSASAATSVTNIQLQRETITFSPVFSAMLPARGPNGEDLRTGYIRLSSFSQNAGIDMEKAVAELEKEGAASYILDLRSNPGGLVRAGLEVAQIWLGGGETAVNTIDRGGHLQPIVLHHKRALTNDPLVVLVNQGSASASEILAGALHDNGRAVLVGDNTYGKGKIQSVFELNDGSALFVTVAKYLSPNLHQIDQIGIPPDMQCSAQIPVQETAPPVVLPLAGPGAKGPNLLKQAIMMELDPTAQLRSDSCVLTAEQLLIQKQKPGSSLSGSQWLVGSQ